MYAVVGLNVEQLLHSLVQVIALITGVIVFIKIFLTYYIIETVEVKKNE